QGQGRQDRRQEGQEGQGRSQARGRGRRRGRRSRPRRGKEVTRRATPVMPTPRKAPSGAFRFPVWTGLREARHNPAAPGAAGPGGAAKPVSAPARAFTARRGSGPTRGGTPRT